MKSIFILPIALMAISASAQDVCGGPFVVTTTDPTCVDGQGNIQVSYGGTCPNTEIYLYDSTQTQLLSYGYYGHLNADVPAGQYWVWGIVQYDDGTWHGPVTSLETITNPSCLAISSTIIVTDAHQGCNDGRIDVIPVNRQPNSCTYIFDWAYVHNYGITNPGEGSAQYPLWGDTVHFDNLSAGVFDLLISEWGCYCGCHEEEFITINEIPCSFSPTITTTDPTTPCGTDGTMTILENEFHCQNYQATISSASDILCSFGSQTGYPYTLTTNCSNVGVGFSEGTYDIHFWDILVEGCTADYSVTFTSPPGAPLYYADVDGDGYGDSENSISSCTLPEGFVTNNLDCNDSNISMFPDAPGTHQGIDNNCNGAIEGGEEIDLPGDFDFNGSVNTGDLLLMMSQYGCVSSCGIYDFDGNGVVNTGDLLLFMSLFGNGI